LSAWRADRCLSVGQRCCPLLLSFRQELIDVGERSGQLRPYVRPVARHCRWPSWVCAYVSGTNLSGVLEALALIRYCLISTTESFPSRCCGLLLDQSGLHPSPAIRRGGVCSSLRHRRDTALRTVDLFARHHRPGDARHLVGQCHGHQSDRATLENRPEPGADRAVPSVCSKDHRRGP
jgi:hypothetical protein